MLISGAICTAWDIPTPLRLCTVPLIVRHILSRHCGVRSESVQLPFAPLLDLIRPGIARQMDSEPAPEGVWPHAREEREATLGACKAFDELSALLRSLPLPLPVIHIAHSSAALCGTAVHPPEPHPLLAAEAIAQAPYASQVVEPIDVVFSVRSDVCWYWPAVSHCV